MPSSMVTQANPPTRVMTDPGPVLYGVPMEDNVPAVARGVIAANCPREPNQPPGGTSWSSHPRSIQESGILWTPISAERRNILRVVVQNINSISEEPHSKDNKELLAFVRNHEIDIMCLSELNKC